MLSACYKGTRLHLVSCRASKLDASPSTVDRAARARGEPGCAPDVPWHPGSMLTDSAGCLDNKVIPVRRLQAPSLLLAARWLRYLGDQVPWQLDDQGFNSTRSTLAPCLPAWIDDKHAESYV
jgi:hypothetical protein